MKVRVQYQWMRWTPVQGSAVIEIPDDLKGCHCVEEYLLNYPEAIAAKICAVKNVPPHCGDLSAGIETGYAKLRLQ